MKCINSVKEAIGMSPQELSMAVDGRTLWTPLIHITSRSQSQRNTMTHEIARHKSNNNVYGMFTKITH